MLSRGRRRPIDRWRLGLGVLLGPYLVGAVALVAVPALLSLGLAFTTYDGLSALWTYGPDDIHLVAAAPSD